MMVTIMKVNRVEQHIISKSNPIWKTVDEYCFRSKNLYNQANYVIRQEFIKNKNWIRANELDKMLQKEDCYKELGSQAAQKTIQLLDKKWKSYFKSIKDWSKNNNKYLGKPRIPNYKDKENGRYILMLKNIQCKIKDGYLQFSWNPFREFKIKTNITGRLIQVRFVPKENNHVLEVVYEIEIPEIAHAATKIASIDIGINNLAAISNNINLCPLIINGRPLKSINQFYNKTKALLQSDLKMKHDKNWSNKLQKITDRRFNRVKNYIHKASKFILNWIVENRIDTIVVGRNINWKQESSMGNRNNQNFATIPFEMFINQIKYKCENVGIKFIETEESYTSGTSFLDNEPPIKECYNKSRRVQRGLFKSNKEKLINADLNGSYQIMKKVFPNVFDDGIEGVGLHPFRVNLI